MPCLHSVDWTGIVLHYYYQNCIILHKRSQYKVVIHIKYLKPTKNVQLCFENTREHQNREVHNSHLGLSLVQRIFLENLVQIGMEYGTLRAHFGDDGTHGSAVTVNYIISLYIPTFATVCISVLILEICGSIHQVYNCGLSTTCCVWVHTTLIWETSPLNRMVLTMGPKVNISVDHLELLIELARQHPCIYYPKDSDHKDAVNIWANICRVLQEDYPHDWYVGHMPRTSERARTSSSSSRGWSAYWLLTS